MDIVNSLLKKMKKANSLNEYVHIYNLFIHPKFRRQGKAKILLQNAIECIRKTGYNGEIQIVAEPQENSICKENLITFYKSMGLVVYECYL
jgi:ribosomal protein S18 acetylase RimI-like enzyme